jgi:hypothetical protein
MDDDYTEDQLKCMETAAPLLQDLYDGWYAAFGKYKAYDPAFTAEHDDTTAANCVRSHMLQEIIERFEGRRGCTILRLSGLSLLNYRDELVWRFKKVDGSGRHRNYQTKQQEDFDDQKDLPNIPPKAARLTSGYNLDAAGQIIERIVVSRPLGRTIVWSCQINMINGAVEWEDITPVRLPGTSRFDYRGRRRGAG